MDWFKRYGIPGAYSMGLTLVCMMILYPCRIDLSDEKTLKIMVGLFTGGFLPFGYLMYLVGQMWYFLWCCCSNKCGRHARARHIAKTNFDRNIIPVDIEQWALWAEDGIQDAKILWIHPSHEKETLLAACSILDAVSDGKWDLKKDKYVQEWIRKRTDIVVMNQTIMAGTIVCSIGVLSLNLLSGWSLQPYEHRDWIWTLTAVICLHFIICYVTNVVRIRIDIVIAGVFRLRRRDRRIDMELSEW